MTDKTQWKVKLPSNEVILYALALGSALTFAYSFLYLDGGAVGFMWFLLLVRGLVLGGAAGLGMAKVSNALPRTPKTFRGYAWGAFALFLIVTPFIVAPVAYTSMNPLIVASIPNWLRWLVSIAVGLFVDAVTAGVALTSGKLEPETKPESQPAAETKAKAKPESEAVSETKPVEAKAEPVFSCSFPGCSVTKPTQAALNAHQAKHKAKAEQTKPDVAGYTVNLEPVDSTGKLVNP